MSKETANATASRRKPWWRRLCKWAAWTVAIFLILAVIAWQFRTPIANAVLRKTLPEFPAEVGGISWENGGLTVRNLKLSTRDGAETILLLPEGHVELKAGEATSGKLGKIRLRGPELQLGPGFWKEAARLGASENTAPPTDTGAVLSAAGIDIQAAKVRIEIPDGGRISGQLEWEGGPMAYHADGAAAAERQKLKLAYLKYESGANSAPMSAANLEADFSLTDSGKKLVVHRLNATGLDAPAGEAFWKSLGLSGLPVTPTSPSMAAALETERKGIEQVEIEDCHVGPVTVKMDSLPWLPQLPPVAATLTIHGGSLAGATDGAPRAGMVQVTVENLTLGPESSPAWVTIPKFTAHLATDAAGTWRVDQAELSPSPVHFDRSVSDHLKLPSFPVPDIRGEISGRGRGIAFGSQGVSYSSPLELTLANFSAKIPGAGAEFATWKSLRLAASPPELLDQKRLRLIDWQEPAIFLTGDDFRFFSSVPAADPSPPTANTNTDSKPEFWDGLRCDDLKIAGGTVQTRSLGDGIPDAALKFRLETAPLTTGGDKLHQFTCEEILVAQPGQPKAPPLYRGQNLAIVVHPHHLWSKHQIESVQLRGSRMEIGATDQDLYVPESTLAPAATSYAPAKADEIDDHNTPEGWHIRQVHIEDTKIHLHGLIPDVSEILVPISHKTMTFVPLTMDGLRQRETMERIELPLVYVPGTRPGTSVADLDTNFVHFSIAGLLQKRVDLVEMVNPKIYVGDSLFHYVDKFRAENAAAKPPAVTAMGELLTSLVTLLTGEELPAPQNSPDGWSIKRLRLINGKLFSTVKDSPLIRVPPLPFGADSALADGEINAELAIPPGIYKPVLGLELVARINEGRVVFNLPKKQKSNNLVQVIKADWLRYKQFRIADVALSVTYDENGIYTQFWAKGYGGDLSGAFNLYLDDQLSWDMWIAGNNVNVGEITKTLTPNYFTMDGRINFKIIAQGDKASLYQATGEFRGLESGRTNIVALEDIIKNIPEDWGDAQRKWTIKALETLRDFRYDRCTGDLRFYGLEGTIHLNLSGPDGQRNFEVNSHDRRLRVEPKPQP